MKPEQDTRLRVAAIGFLNPAPLMWDFEHPPLDEELAKRYIVDRMTPSECAARLADGRTDIGLIPIASLATTPGLRILPGCTIASKGKVRSLILVHRAGVSPSKLRSVAADAASRTTLIYSRMMFHKWGNAEVPFCRWRPSLTRCWSAPMRRFLLAIRRCWRLKNATINSSGPAKNLFISIWPRSGAN
ncbi:MAG: MqnA/MqnD/SBP family protein [Terracidiphilus sp.]